MTSSRRRFSILGVFMLVGLVTLSGCATRGFVRNEVGGVGTRVDEVEATIEEQGERIDAVDERAQEGITQARNAAQTAQQAADQAEESAQTANRAAETAQQTAQQAVNRIGTVENRISALNNYSVAQTESVRFDLNSSTLSDDAQAALNQLATQFRPGDFFEVQGYTDSTGGDTYNLELSERRAQAVTRHLVSQDVPLFRIQQLGLGEAMPAAPNETREGREQNRRVEVRLMRAAAASN